MHKEELSYLEFKELCPTNLTFSVAPMEEVYEKADLCITCSSTAGVETCFRGIPTLFFLDYEPCIEDVLYEPAKRLLADSGLLVTEEELMELPVRLPNEEWIKDFYPEEGALEKIFSIKDA